jgi:SAM-dependent methyltransferase
MITTTDSPLKTRLHRPQFPRSSAYDPHWILDGWMGPHVLWQTEWLSQAMDLKPGMRILDLGCGKASSSLFLAQEFGVNVHAADLWIKPGENLKRIQQAGLEHLVTPVHAEAHALSFAEGSFDAIVSLDAYHYFGTDDLYLGYITRFLKAGGQIGIVVPGVREELTETPEHLKSWWDWEFCSFHSPEWWKRHWSKTGLVEVETTDAMPDGWKHWMDWCEICADAGVHKEGSLREAEMLRTDQGKTFGFTRVVARKPERKM